MSTLDCVVPRAELVVALSRLSGVIPARTNLPVFQCVRISREEEALKLEATDGDRHAEVSARVVDGDGAFHPFCVPFATLRDFVKDFGGLGVRLSEAPSGLALSVPGSRATLPVIPASEFPSMRLDGTDFVGVASGPALALKTALSLVGYAICTEFSKPALLGVDFGRRGDGIFATASDAWAVVAKERVEAWEGEMEPATIPSAAVNGLLRFLPDEGGVRLLASETRLRFVHDSAGTFTTGTLSDPFPAIVETALREDGHDSVARVSRDELRAAVRRVALVLRDEQLPRTEWTLADGALSIRAETELGTAEEAVAADVACPHGLLIGFSATYVAETLNSLSGDTVRIAIKGPRNGTLWSNDGESAGSVRAVWPLNLNP